MTYVVGEMVGVSTNVYRIESIERNTNEACTGGPLHSVHLVDVVTGERCYMYATTEQITPEPTPEPIPDPGGLAREVMMRSE